MKVKPSKESTNLNRIINNDWIKQPNFIDTKEENDVSAFLAMKQMVKVFYHLNCNKFLTEKEIAASITFYGICMDQINESSGVNFCVEIQSIFINRMKRYQIIAEQDELFEFTSNSEKFMSKFI